MSQSETLTYGIDRDFAPYALLILRVALGTMWIAHASLKWFVFTMPGFEGWLNSMGLPGAMAWPVFLMEFIGGCMIILGFYGRYVSLVLLPIMLVALSTHVPNGWVFSADGGGWEYPLFLAVASMVHGLAGDGALALKGRDSLFGSSDK